MFRWFGPLGSEQVPKRGLFDGLQQRIQAAMKPKGHAPTPTNKDFNGAGGIMPEKRQRSPLSANFYDIGDNSKKISGQQRLEA
ncbi:hypothetical protein J31TS3_20030 [Paenibacillus lactis]|nr:hypothetical protein J31TS3_20030 [Paenibacillus lactis]